MALDLFNESGEQEYPVYEAVEEAAPVEEVCDAPFVELDEAADAPCEDVPKEETEEPVDEKEGETIGAAGVPVTEETQPTVDDESPAETEPAIPVDMIEGKLAEILEAQAGVATRLDALAKLFDARIMYADHEKQVVDLMHKELQAYKEDFYAKIVRPVLLDFIEIRDSFMKLIANYEAKPEGERDIPLARVKSYSYDFADILEKNGIEIYNGEVGAAYVAVRQKIIKRVVTDDESLHGTVAEVLSSGYTYGGKVIVPEKVAVYLYQKPTENTENN